MQRFITGILVALTVATALVAGTSAADAATGARGKITVSAYVCSPASACQNESTQPAGFAAAPRSDGTTTKVERRLAGWAYNPRTAPVQTYVLKFYNSNGALLHTSAQYTANLPDAKAAARLGSSTNRIGWHYSTGFQPYSSTLSWAKACLLVHDKGEVGHWTTANCQLLYMNDEAPVVY